MQLTPQGPITTVVWTWKLRPITGEPGVIPSVTIPYYDTTEERIGQAVIPAAPIGYATGARGAEAGWERGFVGGWVALLVLAAGALTSLVVTSGARRLSASAVRALAVGAPFDPDLRSLRRTARGNDLKRFRACAARLLTRAGRSEAETVQTLAPLDRHLFGRDQVARPELATLGRRLRQLAKHR